MYDPPAYLRAITIAGPTAIAAATCIVLYGGAERAGPGRRRAALPAGAAAVLPGGWFTATALIAGHGWYHTLPWYPVAAAGFPGTLLALSRIPVAARALAAPGMPSRLELPHMPRVAGVAFLLSLALGHLPALFALPAGLGDIAAGIARSDERGAAVPLMGPADHGSASPLMGPAAAGTVTPLMGPAAPATVTPLLGPADRGTMVSLMGPADPGTATPLMLPSR